MGEEHFPALKGLLERDAAATLLLEGLIREYAPSAASGRLKEWVACGRAILTLIESRGPTVYDNAPTQDQEP